MGRAARAKQAKVGEWNPTCVIQARMGSTRLPGKVLMLILGKSCLERVVERVRLTSRIQQIVVATSELEQDDAIVDACEAIGVDWYRGSEQDVLARYVETAEHFRANPIVRVTADCPLIDPEVLDFLVSTYRQYPGRLVTNSIKRTFPLGLDAQVFPLAMLKQAAAQTGEDYDAEHVVRWMMRQPGAVNVEHHDRTGKPVDLSGIRLTLDTRDDLTLIRALYRALKEKPYPSTADVVWLLNHRPELARLAAEAA